jgi:hypothetical protein
MIFGNDQKEAASIVSGELKREISCFEEDLT